MKVKHHKIDQNTEEWLDLRKGKFTASSFKNLFLSKTTAGYNNEIYRVAYEHLTDESPETFSNEYMDRGHELEPFARKEYELQSFNDVEDGGFFELNKFVGCSPDGLIGDDGGLEIKCPKYSTMIQYLLSQKLPTEYYWQVQGSLYVTGRKWWDFMAYHPKLKSLVLRIYPDQEAFGNLITELDLAIKRAKDIIERLK